MSDDMTMVERVARAICKADNCSDNSWNVYINIAKAAIKAIREPTEVMLDAGTYASDMALSAKDQYSAMIDAALKDA